MIPGNRNEFSDAWQNLREAFVCRLAREYYDINISNTEARLYGTGTNSLSAVLNEIRKYHFSKSAAFRIIPRLQKMFWRDPVPKDGEQQPEQEAEQADPGRGQGAV